MNINDEAVEAAARAMLEAAVRGSVMQPRDVARAALEAAAPHLMAAAWDEGWDTFAGFDSRPGGRYPSNPYRSEERGTE